MSLFFDKQQIKQKKTIKQNKIIGNVSFHIRMAFNGKELSGDFSQCIVQVGCTIGIGLFWKKMKKKKTGGMTPFKSYGAILTIASVELFSCGVLKM